MGESTPSSLVVESLARDAVERCAVEKPGDLLVLPAGGTSVDNHRPGVEVIVGDVNSLAESMGFVAGATALMSTVDSTKARHVAVDSLKDVDLTTTRPPSTMTEGIAEHPKGRPHALLTGRVAHSNAGLDTESLVLVCVPCLLGLETSRGPVALAVPPGNELECIAARELDVLVGSAVHLKFVVGVDVESRVPVITLGSAALATSELVLPEQLESGTGGSTGGGGQRGQGGEDGEEVEHRVSRSETFDQIGERCLEY